MDPREVEFERRLRDSIRESIRLGYNPIRIAQMIDVHGGKETARRLVVAGEIQEGIRTIIEMGHPELSVESILLEPEFAALFAPDVLEAARWRLDRAKEGGREDSE